MLILLPFRIDVNAQIQKYLNKQRGFYNNVTKAPLYFSLFYA